VGHKDQAIDSLNAGKHVFIEKPIGMDVKECLEIKAVADKSNKQFFVGFMRRYDPSYIEAKRRIDAGEIGTPILYRGYSWDPVWVAEYLAKRAEQNGCWFLDMGVHDYDIARWFLGSEAKKVFACGGAYAFPVFDKTNDIDNGYALIEFENKSAAFIYPGRTAAHGSHVEGEIIGTKGSIRIGDDPNIDKLKLYTSQGITKKVYTHYLERWDQAYINEVQAFIDVVLGNSDEKGPDALDGSMAVMMGLTVQKAYVSGELEKFEEM
jgi:myo-inositol 2-dehydrogenase/D-chiro-inositol 1-dehydrogenase